MLNKDAFALEIVRGDPELTADCRVTLNRGDRIGSLDCIHWFPHPIDASHEIWLQLAKWFQRRRCLNIMVIYMYIAPGCGHMSP